LLDKYPEHSAKIKKAMTNDSEEINSKKEHQMSIEELRVYRAQVQRERADRIYKDKKAEKVQNQTYEKQKQIQKKLVTPMGEETENESEAEGDA
jgi:Spy/CpxP family protein refolding chaperone